jgi:catechol 2,3-dioxygenase-like lactoylglutathione lyase family enzyme
MLVILTRLAAVETLFGMLAQIDHVNLVVADLERMIAFYTTVLGLRLTKRVTISGEWIAAVVGLSDVHADVAYLDFPSGPRIELIRYNRPAAHSPAEIDRANTPGIRHLAFKVDDIDAAAARLGAAGVNLFSGVQSVPETQVTYAGGVRKRLAYFSDPEGNLLELCEYSRA